MKFKVLVSVIAVLAISFTPQVGALPPKAMPSDDLKVEALPPDGGTVTFTAQTGENPASGVEIRIDGESKGFTGEDGKLKVEWLLFGDHLWKAFHGGKEVCRGEFEIPRIVDIEILDFYFEKNGRRITGLYPLKDTIAALMVIKNIGTTVVDHVTFKITSIPSKDDVEIKLIDSKIPSFILNLFKEQMLEMFCSKMGRQLVIKDGKATLTNTFTGEPSTFEMREPFLAKGVEIELPPQMEGIKPGEVYVGGEKRLYARWITENMVNWASQMDTTCEELADAESEFHVLLKEAKLKYKKGFLTLEVKVENMEMETMSGENGIIQVGIEKCSWGVIKIEDTKVIAQLKGPIKEIFDIYIDDKLYDSREFDFNYLYKESIGGEPVGEI